MSAKKETASKKAAAEETTQVTEAVQEAAKEVAETAKKKPGRKAMSAAEKAEAAKARAEQKKLAENLKPVTLIQHQDYEINTDDLIEKAKAAFRQEKKRTLITELKLYIKPDERAAYYVINGDFTGQVYFF